MRFFIICFTILFYSSPYSQTDWVMWEKAEISYTVNHEKSGRGKSFLGNSFDETIVNSLANLYWIFISDVDGDNCPFHPSCSSFYLESVKHTGFFQGTLMFFDRFTRDINFVNRRARYPRLPNYKVYDPVSLYTLDEESINYYPPSKKLPRP
jgi:putative component of membrane protein insertase Oxa1/YidC/SpoIIIJ protein YidD